MNVLELVKEINSENIEVKEFGIDYVAQEINVRIDTSLGEKLIAVHNILEKYSKEFSNDGFKLRVTYTI